MQPFLSSSFSRGLSFIFCSVLLLSFIFEISRGGGVATPVTPPPPLDQHYKSEPPPFIHMTVTLLVL